MSQMTSVDRIPRRLVSLSLLALAALAPATVRAAPPQPAKAPPADTAAEVARLKAEVAEQRQLIMQLVRVEQEHYDLLLKLVQGRAAPGEAAAPAPGLAPATPAAPAAAPRAPRTGTVRGKVAFPGGTFKDVYVYVDNVKSPPAHGHTFEIGQRDKQFVPQVAVVQRGTKVVFPN